LRESRFLFLSSANPQLFFLADAENVVRGSAIRCWFVSGNAGLPLPQEDKDISGVGLEEYEPFIGETVERITRKAQRLRGLRMVNISSTFYGGMSPRCCRQKPCWHAASACKPIGA
jgi:hypothetical protein